MSARIITSDMKLYVTSSVFDSFQDQFDTTYHIVGGNSADLPSPIPTPKNSPYTNVYGIHDTMLFGKRVGKTCVRRMIRNIPWEAGKEYEIYDDQLDDLINKNFYVVVDQTDDTYAVFKCLKKPNVSNPITSHKPNVTQTTPADNVYITSDGYHWKYMYSISSADYDKWATENYVPITANTEVSGNASSGAIDTILVESGGAQYNNYATGSFKEINVNGNTVIFNIKSDTFLEVNLYDIQYTSNTADRFSEGDEIEIAVPGANTITAVAARVGPSSVSFATSDEISDITETTVQTSNGAITLTANTVTADVLRITKSNISSLSLDDDFYKGATIYIRSGEGAGQARDILAYTVTGDERLIEIDSPWNTNPDTATRYTIAPKIDIIGDGSNALAIPIIDNTSNTISDIQIIDRGQNYSFATAVVTGNTGQLYANGDIIYSTPAQLRPIISPIGGHGADIFSELYATNIGISTTFANTEVLTDISFNNLALVKNLLADNVEITLDSGASAFDVGEIITQNNTTASGEITSIDSGNNILHLTNVLGTFLLYSTANNLIQGANSGATGQISSINKNTNVFNNIIDLGVSMTSSVFSPGEIIVQNETGAKAKVISANSSVVTITNFFSEFDTSNTVIGQTSQATGIVNTKSDKPIVDNSGNVLYIENTANIDRSNTTSEQVKIVIKF